MAFGITGEQRGVEWLPEQDDHLDHLTDDHFHDECGVVGVYGHPQAARMVALGLHALQHRGQEAAGITTYHNGHFYTQRHTGLVGDSFTSRP